MTDHKTPVVARVFACPLPRFEDTLNPDDRALYHWLDRIPSELIPAHLGAERDRIAGNTEAQRYEQQAVCEQSRFPEQSESESRLRLRVVTQLGHDRGVDDRNHPQGISGKVRVSFDPDSGYTPPEPPPPIPFELIHYVDRLGINDYTGDTNATFTQPAPELPPNGLGPWAGGRVVLTFDLDYGPTWLLQLILRSEVRLSNPLLFDHWASVKPWRHPAPPPAVLQRVEPYEASRLEIQTPVPYDPIAGDGQGHGFKAFVEFTHVPSGRSLVSEHWLSFDDKKWSAHERGGYGIDATFAVGFPFNAVRGMVHADGLWRHRVCIAHFQRPASPVQVRYDGRVLAEGTTDLASLASADYVPGVTLGIAHCEEEVRLFTVGATKAHCRLLDIQPVPGFGLLVTLKVINDFHVPACIASTVFTGCRVGDRLYLPPLMVVRNLPAYSESAAVKVLLPFRIPGFADEPLRFQDYMQAFWHSFAMPPDQVKDGIYGSRGPYPELFNWPPPAWEAGVGVKASAYSFYNTRGERFWGGNADPGYDRERVIETLPVRRGPGPELIQNSETHPGYWDQEPFVMLFDWQAEEKVYPDKDVWAPRSGRGSMSLGRIRAIERYGRIVTVATAQGRPLWLPYQQCWAVVFESWSGGTVDEVEAFLLEQFKEWQFAWSYGVRNFQYSAIKRPLLIAGLTWHYANEAFIDVDPYFNAAVVVNEYPDVDTVEIAFTGRRD